MHVEHLLLIDDERDFLTGIKRLLEREFPSLAVHTAATAGEARQYTQARSYDLVLLDIKMPEMDGLELLEELRRHDHELTVVMLTAHGTIDTAVAAIKTGAWDFLTKPVDRQTLCNTVKKGLERNRLKRENLELKQQLQGNRRFIGRSPALRRFLAQLHNAAATDYNVLIRGESGTGKELAARAIHQLSARKKGPLVLVNCPAIPEHLLESELFGHCRGAFTGADRDTRGLFLAANGGTLVLDEIGDIPLAVQTKLLRVLEEQEIKPLGSHRTIGINVRIVAATNQDLEQKIIHHTFREDLYYRLNVLSLRTPSLAEMQEDIPELAEHFLRQAALETGREPPPLDAATMASLTRRPWSGNVRELKNAMRRLLVTGSDSDDNSRSATARKTVTATSLPYCEAREKMLADFTRDYFAALLRQTDGNVSRAAELAGVHRSALQKILRRFDIDAGRYRRQPAP